MGSKRQQNKSKPLCGGRVRRGSAQKLLSESPFLPSKAERPCFPALTPEQGEFEVGLIRIAASCERVKNLMKADEVSSKRLKRWLKKQEIKASRPKEKLWKLGISHRLHDT